MAAGALLGGGLIGGVVQGVGSAIEAYQARVEASRLRRRTRKGIAEGEARTQKEVFDVLQSPEFQTVRSFALGTYGVANPGNAAGGAGASFGGRDFLAAPTGAPVGKGDRHTAAALATRVDDYMSAQRALSAGVDTRGRPLTDADRTRLSRSSGDIRNTLLAARSLDAGGANEFASALARRGVNVSDYQALAGRELGDPQVASQQLESQGGGIVETPLTQAFRSQIRQTQAARGIFDSQAAAAAEASGLAAFQYEQQRNMLPFLLQMSTFGNDIYHRYETANIGREVQRATGGVGVYGAQNPFTTGQSVIGAAFGGFAGGALSGASLGVQLQNYLGGQGGGRPAPPVQYRDPFGGVANPFGR